MQPATTADVIALLDDRAAFLRANLQAGLLPNVQQMCNFLATLVAQTEPWASMATTASDHRNALMQMFRSMHWDCISNGPIAHLAPPLPGFVLEALVRQRHVLDQAIRQFQQPNRAAAPVSDRAAAPRKRARKASQEHNAKRAMPPVFGKAPQPGSPPTVLLVFDLNGTILTRRRGNIANRNRVPQTTLQANSKPAMIRPHLQTVLDKIAMSAQKSSTSTVSCMLTAGVWTSAMAHNMLQMVSAAFGARAALELRFTAHREHCSPLSAVQAKQKQRRQHEEDDQGRVASDARARHFGTVKDLEKLWEQHPAFNAKTTVLIDDSEVKASLQPRNLLLLPSFDEESHSCSADGQGAHDDDDDVLLGLSAYLEELQTSMIRAFKSAAQTTESPDVRQFLEEHPFGAWLVAWRQRQHEKQTIDCENSASAKTLSSATDASEVGPITIGKITSAEQKLVASGIDSARLGELLDGAVPNNRAERRAIVHRDRTELIALARTAETKPPEVLQNNRIHDGRADADADNGIALDASKLEETKPDRCCECEQAKSTRCNSSAQQNKRKKPRWTQEEKLLRQRQQRRQSQKLETERITGSNDSATTVGATIFPVSLSKPVAAAATTQLLQWNGPVFCNLFAQVARAVHALPSTGTEAAATISQNGAATIATLYQGSIVDSTAGENNVRSISIHQLCQLPEISVCRLHTKLVCQALTALNHERMKLSEDGQTVLFSA